MSELTTCNYCDFQHIKRLAKERGMKVVKTPGWRGGIDVFMVPKSIKKKEIRAWKDCDDDEAPPNGDENYEKYHAAWFMELPGHCCC